MLFLIAEGAETIGPWANMIATLASAGFAGWVAFYLLTKALPGQNGDFLKTLDAIQKQTAAALKEMEVENRAALKELQASFEARDHERRSDSKEALAAIVAHCEREAIRRDDVLKAELSLVTKATSDQREVLEEFRDVLREFLTSRQRRTSGLRRPEPPRPTGT